MSLQFMPVLTGAARSRIDKELDDSMRKSHLARAMHRKRREQVRPVLNSMAFSNTDVHKNYRDQNMTPYESSWRSSSDAVLEHSASNANEDADGHQHFLSIVQHKYDVLSATTSSPFDQQLLSSLDPFVRLPLNTSSREKSLLHWALTEGRTLAHRNHFRPKYDLAVHSMALILEHCPMAALTMISLAVSLQSRAAGRPESTEFYTLMSRALSTVRKIISDPDSSFFDKALCLNQLAVLSRYTGREEAQKQHLLTQYRYIQEEGGLSRFFGDDRPTTGNLDVAVYASNFIWIEIPVMCDLELNQMLTRLLAVLTRLRFRVASFVPAETEEANDSSKLSNLQSYLDWLLASSNMPAKVPRHFIVGTVHFIFTLAATQVVYKLDAVTSAMFLEEAGTWIQPSYAPHSNVLGHGGAGHDLVPISHIAQAGSCMLSYVRSCLGITRPETEVELSQLGLDLIRLVPLLSHATILRLIRGLSQCVFVAVKRETVECGDCLGVELIQDVMREIVVSWKTSRM